MISLTRKEQVRSGERCEGLLPPVVPAPAFAIRKPAVALFTLENYIANGILSAEAADHLRDSIIRRSNILATGGTSTGKNTLTNALLLSKRIIQKSRVIVQSRLFPDKHRHSRLYILSTAVCLA